MSTTSDSTLDPQRLITELQRQLAESNAERDEAQQQLIERTAERDDGEAQKAAMAEVLGVINASPGDLAPVFDAMVEKALRLCEATRGTLRTYDGETFHLVASAQGEALPLPSAGQGQSSLFRRFIDGEQIVHLADVLNSPEYQSNPSVQQGMDAARARSWLGVSLRKNERLLGVISVVRQEVRPFTEKQIALLQNFAAQAVIAIENARLITETREALEQQTATAEVLGVINASPGNLGPVFEAMLDKAMRLCEAAFGGLWTYDGGNFRSAAMSGVPEPFAYFNANNPPVFGPGSGPARLVEGEPFNHIVDLTASEAYLTGEPNRKALVDLGGARTALAVPLRKDDALVGLIMIYRQEVRPFADKQVALLQNFAAQAVIAMENARLIAETREALEQQTATAEVLQVINSSPGDLAPVFDAMLERAVRLCEFDLASLWTYDGSAFHPAARHRVPDPLWAYLQDHTPPPFARLVDGDRLVHIADVHQEAIYQTDYGREVRRLGLDTVRSLLIVPLRREKVLLGLIGAYRHEVRPFTDKQIALLESFAAQAVIAMENARLITETREALDQQTATAEVLQVINASPGDLTPVFEAILEKAHRICSLTRGSLVTYDGSKFNNVARHGVGEQVSVVMSQARSVPWTAQRALLRGNRLVHIPDLLAYSWDPDDTVMRPYIEASNLRAGLLVPLRKDGVLLGYISSYRDEAGPFSEKEIALLESFAAQAVIAIENARLLGELRERTTDLEESLEYQTATSDVLKIISQSTFDLQPVLDTLVETAAGLCDADGAGIATQQGDVYRYVATFSINPAWQTMVRDLSFKPGRDTITGRALLERGMVHVADIAAEPEHAVPQIVTVGGVRTMLAVPLLREGKPIGVLAVARYRVQPFTERQIELVTTFADQAVIAMENARLLGELRQRTEEVGELNRDLEARVAEQVDELGRVGRLKRFLAPQLAELIVSQGDEKILESHRREIVVVFCDLRGYTAFTETAEPEEVLDFLREYHGALGPLVSQFEGTLDQFSGDGIMVFFNDPVPCADPAERAVKMAVAMRSVANTLIADWRERGRDLGFGAGIAQGYATLGQIGFSERSGYTAIGTVCNVAARLCAEAKDGQILLSQRVNVALKGSVATEQLGPLTLKGLTQPVVAYNVPLGAIQPAFRVIEGGSPETV